jgi:A/G-specific adenine glycosylase
MKNKNFFSESLIKWDRNENKREMPWKQERDPYKIWISEIILQQTRVSQGWEYYKRFIKAFPDIRSLSEAPEKEVFKLWEGLGYYSRCRNLIATAKHLCETSEGRFPEKYEDLLQLKGIGTYTAAAIASFAFNQPYAVLDGNVFRVLSRFFAVDTPVDSVKGKKLFSLLAASLIDRSSPAVYNQAIMDFGAVICKPALPLCHQCPLQPKCQAFRIHAVSSLPVKTKKIAQTHRFFNYLILRKGNGIYVHKRTAKDIWENLYEFVLIETDRLAPEKEFLSSPAFLALLGSGKFQLSKTSAAIIQKLTHQKISGRFFHIDLHEVPVFLKTYDRISPAELKELPFPKIIATYLKEKKYL